MLAIHLLRVLRRLQDARAIEAIRDAADDPHPWIRSHALLVLGGLRDLASLEIIERHLKDEDAECRKAALFALASVDQAQDQPFRLAVGTKARVRVYLGDPDPYVRMQAALLLAQAGDSDGVLPLLAKMLDRQYLRDLPFSGDLHGTNRGKVNSNLLVQTILAVSGLDAASDNAEIKAALKRLTDDSIEGDPEVRQQARVALGKLLGSSTG
jgi:HEAT repeat protein